MLCSRDWFCCKTSFSFLSRSSISLKLHTMRVLGQRSNNDLDLLFSQIFMYSLRQLLLPIFRQKSSKVFMKSYVVFSHS